MSDLRVRWIGLRAGCYWPWIAVKKGYDRWAVFYSLWCGPLVIQWCRRL